MLPVLPLGPLSLPVPGFAMLLSVWLGLTLSERLAPKFGLPKETLNNLILIGLVAGVIGARISYLASVPGIFISDPLSLFALDQNMFDPVAGLLIGVLAGAVYISRKGVPALPVLDGITPFLAALMIGRAFSNLASGASYGEITTLPWAIKLWGAYRHPTQIYNLLTGLGILTAVWPRENTRTRPHGVMFFTFIALTAGSQLLIEGFRADSELIATGLRSAQIVSWFILAGSLWAVYQITKTSRSENESSG